MASRSYSIGKSPQRAARTIGGRSVSFHITNETYVDGLDDVLLRLRVMTEQMDHMSAPLRTLQPYLSKAIASRFEGRGASPEFGFEGQWKPLSEKTVENRNSSSLANPYGMDAPLVERGKLEKAVLEMKPAAISDKYASFSVVAWSDPRPTASSRGGGGVSSDSFFNYATVQQEGNIGSGGNIPARPFVGVTPVMRRHITNVISDWIMTKTTAHREAARVANLG